MAATRQNTIIIVTSGSTLPPASRDVTSVHTVDPAARTVTTIPVSPQLR